MSLVEEDADLPVRIRLSPIPRLGETFPVNVHGYFSPARGLAAFCTSGTPIEPEGTYTTVEFCPD